MTNHKKDKIVVTGSSNDFFSTIKEFNDYLLSLINGSWLQNFGELTGGELSYFLYTSREHPRCIDARILLLTFNGFVKAELHVKPAKIHKLSIEERPYYYKLAFPIQYDERGPIIYTFQKLIKTSDFPIELDFPQSYRGGGAYVSKVTLQYIHEEGKRQRFESEKDLI